jgi:hypothetical protein
MREKMKKLIPMIFLLLLTPIAYAATTFFDNPDGFFIMGGSTAVPTMDAVNLWNQAGADEVITLSVGGTVVVTANTTVTDLDGGGDISSASATLYHSTSTSGAGDDENIHVTNSSCTLGSPSGNDTVVTCTFTMDYMALGGAWIANITASDLGSNSVSATDTNSVNDLAALDVTQATIEFGSLELGKNSSSATTMTVKSQGNIQIDAQFSGTNYSCTSGTISVGNTKYGLITGSYDDLTTALTEDDVTQTSFDLAYRTGGIDSTKNEYWAILIPASGVSGTCSNILTVTAIAG